MSQNQIILQKENSESFMINYKDNIENNSKQKELSQTFNNLYDSNFLIIINELSSQIQSFYKSSITHFKTINLFLSQNEIKIIPKISNIQKSFNNIETLSKNFYSTAKVLFKKMKIYRSEKIKIIRNYSLNNENNRKKNLFINEKKNLIIPSLNLEKIKDNINIINNNDNNSARSSQTTNNLVYSDKSTESNINSNYNNSQSCNTTTIDKESNILLMEEKNQYSNSINEYNSNLNKEIKALEESILSYENNKNNEKIEDIIKTIKKVSSSIKDNLSSFNIIYENQDKKIINNFSNKINLLVEENNKIKKQFEKYKTEERIKRKFFENQIFNLSNKNAEYEKIKKSNENKIKEMKNKYDTENYNLNIKELQNMINEKNIENNILNEIFGKIKKEILSIKDSLIEEKNEKLSKLISFLLSTLNNIPKENNNNKKINNIEENIININLNNNIKISPDDYTILKVYQLNSKLKWILFRKNKKHIIHFRRHSLGNKSNFESSNTIISNKEINNYDEYKDYIWIPYYSDKDFSEFGDISLFIEKEKDYNDTILKLNQKNLINENEIDKLKNENYNLNNIIMRLKSEIKEDKNLMGISLIEDEPENSKFIDDTGCEDILINLDKNRNKENYNNTNLKNTIDDFMAKIMVSENAISLFSSILKQLGCSNDDISKLIGNYMDKN